MATSSLLRVPAFPVASREGLRVSVWTGGRSGRRGRGLVRGGVVEDAPHRPPPPPPGARLQGRLAGALLLRPQPRLLDGEGRRAHQRRAQPPSPRLHPGCREADPRAPGAERPPQGLHRGVAALLRAGPLPTHALPHGRAQEPQAPALPPPIPQGPSSRVHRPQGRPLAPAPSSFCP